MVEHKIRISIKKFYVPTMSSSLSFSMVYRFVTNVELK